ncbi:MAG TPA: hypothetical protein VGI93_23935, partial [Steroidobacteraceae bacterium]
MIGDLLKQLLIALLWHVRAVVARLFGRKPPESITVGPQSAAARRPEKINLRKLSALPGLDAQYLTPIKWPVKRENTLPPELLNDELYKIWWSVSGGLKWSQYFSVYNEIFSPYRSRPIR